MGAGPGRFQLSNVEHVVHASVATVESWKVDFKGNAAESLLDMISVYLAQENVCAQHASIINSSGTGKSRMVDELGRTTISVPICLRKEGSQGINFHRCSE